MRIEMVIVPIAAALIATANISAGTWASLHESAGQWDAALQIYLRFTEAQKETVPDYRIRIHRCIRFSALSQRHRDGLFQSYIQTLKLADSLTLYSDVIEKLSRLYVEADKAASAKLFQHGRDELVKSLADKAFVSHHFRGADEATIRKVQDWLIHFQIHPTATQREIRVAVRDVAIGIRELIPTADPSAIVVEFLCGACRGLDELTAFHPPGTLPKVTAGPSVVDSTIFEERLGIGYLRITDFRDTTATEFDNAVAQLRTRGLRALVIDLRGNPGGLLTAGIEMTRRVLPNGMIVRTTGQDPISANRTFTSESGRTAFELPVVILVDDRTMSAAEVFAGAVKDHARGTLVGTQTYGKGTVQVPLKTTDGMKTQSAGTLILTIAKTSTPNGMAISNGIVPDITERNVDLQLKTAIAHASMLLSVERVSP